MNRRGRGVAVSRPIADDDRDMTIGQRGVAVEGGKLDVQRDEPLRAELADFVGAVRDRREPVVSGQAGRDALALATKVGEAMEASAV